MNLNGAMTNILNIFINMTSKKEKDKIAQKEFGKDYDELNKKQQREVYDIFPTKEDLEYDRKQYLRK